jgi:hypothetical protein
VQEKKKEIFFPEKLKLLTKKLYIATECGSLDFKGLITDLFKEKGLKASTTNLCLWSYAND